MKKAFYLLLVLGQLLAVGFLVRYELFDATVQGNVTRREEKRVFWVSQGLIHREHRRLLYVQTAASHAHPFNVNEKTYHNTLVGTRIRLRLTAPASSRQQRLNEVATCWLIGSLALTFGLTLFPHD